MKEAPNIFIVKAEQVGTNDVNQFIYSALAKQFGENFEVVSESTIDKIVPYATGLRKIKAYAVNAGGVAHSLYFDITETSVNNTINWLGGHK